MGLYLLVSFSGPFADLSEDFNLVAQGVDVVVLIAHEKAAAFLEK